MQSNVRVVFLPGATLDRSYRACSPALPGPGWMPGAKGARGKPGKRGKNGLSVRTMSLTGYTVTTGLSDGSRLHCNLPPALQSYDRARG